jgi:lipid-binding SYLF domain-containing protein
MLLVTSLVVAAQSAPARANQNHHHADDKDQAKLIVEAQQVLTEAVTAPDQGIPKELLEKAECVGVFPGLKKGAFVVGGEFGRGVFTCRENNGMMGAPAFFTLGSGSIGWQFGGESADVVLLIMNPSGVKRLLEDKFAIGGEASAAAGPVGRTATAQTDAQLHAQILSWSRTRGAFLGASIEGSVIKPDKKANEKFYGKSVTAQNLLVDHSVQVPASARTFVDKANDYSRRSS